MSETPKQIENQLSHLEYRREHFTTSIRYHDIALRRCRDRLKEVDEKIAELKQKLKGD